jgi:outer membrane protein OmpA-like peptidoglycan-associated protein
MRDRRLRFPAPLLAVLLVSCAAPKPVAVPAPPAPSPPAPPPNVFVLLPDPDGKVGRIEVGNPRGSVVLSEAGRATRVATAEEPPTAPARMSDQELAATFGPVLAALPAPPARFILYFERDAELTTQARQLVPQILAAIKERGSADISVVGHTDTAGSKEYNYRLSRRRADAVARLLVAGGVAPEALEVTSHGKDNPTVPTGDNVSEPRNRRVEVTVR